MNLTFKNKGVPQYQRFSIVLFLKLSVPLINEKLKFLQDLGFSSYFTQREQRIVFSSNNKYGFVFLHISWVADCGTDLDGIAHQIYKSPEKKTLGMLLTNIDNHKMRTNDIRI